MISLLMSLQQKIDVKRHCCLGTTLVRFIGKYNMLHKQMICDYFHLVVTDLLSLVYIYFYFYNQ